MKRIYFILGGAAVVLILAGVIVYCFIRETEPELEEHMEYKCNKEPMENMAGKDEHVEIEHDLSAKHEKN